MVAWPLAATPPLLRILKAWPAAGNRTGGCLQGSVAAAPVAGGERGPDVCQDGGVLPPRGRDRDALARREHVGFLDRRVHLLFEGVVKALPAELQRNQNDFCVGGRRGGRAASEKASAQSILERIPWPGSVRDCSPARGS